MEIDGAVMDDTQVDDAAALDAEVQVEEQQDDGVQVDPLDQTQEEQADGPKDVTEALKALRAQNPKVAEALRKAHFGHQQYAKSFPTPAEAQQAKESLESIGGFEGITALQSKAASVDLIDEGIASGNKELIDDIFSDANLSKGFAEKLIPYSLDKLQESNPKAYESVMRPHVVASLEEAGLGAVFQYVIQALEGNKPEDAKNIVLRAKQWLDGEKQQAQRAKPAADDPERMKLENDRKEFEKQRDQQFKDDVNRDVLSHRDTEIEKALAPYLKIRKLAGETKDDFVTGVRNEVKAILFKDASYNNQIKAHFSNPKRDKNQIATYMKSKVQGAVPQAVESVWKRRGYGASPRTVRPNPNGTGGNTATRGGVVTLAKKPGIDELDQTVPNWMENFMARRGTMAGGQFKGRQVTWK